MKISYLYRILPLVMLVISGGCSSVTEMQKADNEGDESYLWFDPDTVQAGNYDTGTMWAFEYAPMDYFKETYNFVPTEEWLENVRMAALRFASYCSASFVSADGLIMTNNHCGRESITAVQEEGENLQETGFFAETFEDERNVPGLFVDQLVLIRDVTSEVNQAGDEGKTFEEKNELIQAKIAEIENRVQDSTGLEASITALYNGARYSLYGYKRYNDVRLVFAPETQLAYFGGDFDNFTYPRYNLDCTFFRVYDEEGNPIKSQYYYKWSDNGAEEGEAVFVVGNPGSSARLNTVGQLEYARDISIPRILSVLKDLEDIYRYLIAQNREDTDELLNELYDYTNSLKAYKGVLDGLRNPFLMAKKSDFERKLQEAVMSDPDLRKEYGDIWKNIEQGRNTLKEFSNELFAISLHPLTTSEYFYISADVIGLAEQLKLPESQREGAYKGSELDTTIESLIPEDFDSVYQKLVLEKQIGRLYALLGSDYPLLNEVTGGKRGNEAAEYMLNNSFLTLEEKLKEAIKKGPDAILNSNDPFIYFILNSRDRRNELQIRSSQITEAENVYNDALGRAIFEVYGASIAPDATFTLRITDGVVKGYEYNGTIAPPITTFYGLYEKYYSFKGVFPFNLPKRWQSPPAEFDLQIPFNFISTNDIIGGNSGSAVINKEGEVVGVAFDGNIESLPGNFIFDPEKNRCVAVHSEGMIEAIRDLYKAYRLADELEKGKSAAEEITP